MTKPQQREHPREPAADIDTQNDYAIRLALQQSEGRRLLMIVLVVVFLTVVLWFRYLLQGAILPGWALIISHIILLLTGSYAFLLWILVRRALRQGKLLPSWIWVASTIVESLLPTAALWSLQGFYKQSGLPPLAAPAILLYGVFIVASVLRLRPGLSLASGVICAAGHSWLIYRAVTSPDADLVASEPALLFSYPIFLFLTGVMSALVSREVRKYLFASLREAETRRLLGLVQNEMEIARTIQQGLMPQAAPNLPGFEIAGWNRPASQTGGDYYDWQLLPDGRLAVVIADVTGHGLGPALLMAVCRAYARACVPVGPELCAALQRVNSLLYTDVGDGRFVTLAAAVLDPPSGHVELLSAGHGPILHYRAATKTVQEFNGNGLPLGLLEDESYDNSNRLQLASGDVLLFITDGFVEWARAGDGQLYGVKRLGEFLTRNAQIKAETFIQLLAEDVQNYSGGTPQADDMTAVVIRRL